MDGVGFIAVWLPLPSWPSSSLIFKGATILKWFKHYSDEEESHFIGGLISRFGLKGYYFFERTLSLMAKYFDVTNPGCVRFNRKWYYLQYHPIIKDSRTILKILDFTQYETEIFYYLDGDYIVLYCPSLEKRADNYTMKTLKDILENDKELPPNAGFLHELCRNHAKKIVIKLYKDAKHNAENNEDTKKTV